MSAFLGIHDGHNASVALLRDGRLELALQEERLTRVKNQGDAPLRRGLRWRARWLTATWPDRAQRPLHELRPMAAAKSSWRITKLRRPSWLAVKQPLKNTFIDRAYQRHKAAARLRAPERGGITAESAIAGRAPSGARLGGLLHFALGRSRRERARWCSPATAPATASRLPSPSASADAWIALPQVSEHDSIGRLYALVTRHLAMVPLEHEYKVMGLAPYATSAASAASLAQSFFDLFEFLPGRPGLETQARRPFHVLRLRRGRPHALRPSASTIAAAGVQWFLEHMLTTWVRNAIRETGIANIACSGGVFMNVKANLAMLELPEVEDMYVFPSCGDESNSIGAARHLAAQAGESHPAARRRLYFGEAITDGEAEAALSPRRAASKLRFTLRAGHREQTAAGARAGHIVARATGAGRVRCAGAGQPLDSGARRFAPSRSRVLNQAIKGRDFWMPFAPSVLAERAADYYHKPKPVARPI